MSQIPELPVHLGLSGRWSVSVHYFQAPGGKGPSTEAVFASEEVGNRNLIRSIQVFPSGELTLPPSNGHSLEVWLKNASWIKPFTVKSDHEVLPQTIYEIFSKAAARRILTGHILALKFYPLLRMKELVQKPDMAGTWEKEFKFFIADSGASLTSFTALNYKLLTEWMETSPSQVLAAIEGVSPTTIRNRLHTARESGLIGKPGSGKRSAMSVVESRLK